ncbi:MAG: NADH:flavin oxidoreductase [Candidatus Sumerlaeota bacterium]|nr:NADH:flavin oxidoreductase [Candidatus Sumerlaeota bacterium]
MNDLLQPATLGGISVRNRFVRSATHAGMASPEGEPSDAYVEIYRELARGGVGLIISGFAYVEKRGKAIAGMLGADDDALIPSLQRMAQGAHDEGGRIVLQIAHCGALGRFDTGFPRMGPSAIQDRVTGAMPVEMTPDDIARVVGAFGQAARRAKEAGFDGVQIHSAHGYLASQFLSPYSNRRTDDYGGPIENRARFLFGVYEEIRRQVGRDWPVLVKINCSDFDSVGLNEDDSLWVCRRLSQMGMNAIELSGGSPAAISKGPSRFHIDRPEREGYFQDQARRFKPQLSCPLILVGGLRSPEVIERLFREGAADFFSLCRPLISEPALIRRWESGDRSPARCQSCGKCFGSAAKTGRLRCMTFAEAVE